MTVVSFPSPLIEFHVLTDIPKGIQAECGHLIAGRRVVITAPIVMKTNDHLWVDLHNNKVEIVERDGIVIWRATSQN